MNKKTLFILSLLTFLLSLSIYLSTSQVKKKAPSTTYHEGDIIFQSSHSRQCQAVKLATHSDISHCGILFKEDQSWYVMEAVEPVSMIALDRFIQRGEGEHYRIMRLDQQHNTLTPEKIKAMHDLGSSWISRHYDIFFNWGYGELYCSELVSKLYHDAAGIALCPLRTLKEYDLTSPLVKRMMTERYGNQIPYDESMVAPSDIASAPSLTLVEEH